MCTSVYMCILLGEPICGFVSAYIACLCIGEHACVCIGEWEYVLVGEYILCKTVCVLVSVHMCALVKLIIFKRNE